MLVFMSARHHCVWFVTFLSLFHVSSPTRHFDTPFHLPFWPSSFIRCLRVNSALTFSERLPRLSHTHSHTHIFISLIAAAGAGSGRSPRASALCCWPGEKSYLAGAQVVSRIHFRALGKMVNVVLMRRLIGNRGGTVQEAEDTGTEGEEDMSMRKRE